MTSAVRVQTIEPKNHACFVAVIAGGPADVYRETRAKLRAHGIDACIHWDPDDTRHTSVPSHVDFVIHLKDMGSSPFEGRVNAAAKKSDVPVIRTQRKWAFMQQDLAHFTVLGVCQPLLQEAEQRLVEVPKPTPSDPGEEDPAVVLVREKALAAQAKVDEERKRVEAERAAADERRERHATMQKSMGIVLPAVPPIIREREAQLAQIAAADAEMAREALELAAHEDDDDEPLATGEAEATTKEDPMKKKKTPAPNDPAPTLNGTHKLNGATPPPSVPAPAPKPARELGPALAGLMAAHLRSLPDVSLIGAMPLGVLARLVRNLPDAVLIDAMRDVVMSAFGGVGTPAPHVAPPPAPKPVAEAAPPAVPASGKRRREAPSRAKVLKALQELAVDGGAAQAGEISKKSGIKNLAGTLAALREEGIAFQAGWAAHSFWALSQKAANAAAKRGRAHP